jgi:hypothetical protein
MVRPQRSVLNSLLESYTSRDSWSGFASLEDCPKDEAQHILNALNEYRLAHWGFVIFRCTYASEEKWEKFLARLKELAREFFRYESGPTKHLYDRMDWTIFEDAETLDGADLVQTSRLFHEWWTKGQGAQERRESLLAAKLQDSPRYTYFLHVDEESLESVVDEEKKLEPRGCFCTVVRGGNVLLWEDEGPETMRLWPTFELDDEGLRDHRKRVRVDDLVSLYGVLQDDIDFWYDLYYIDEGEEEENLRQCSF